MDKKSFRVCLTAALYLFASFFFLALAAGVFLLDVHYHTKGGYFTEESLTERLQTVILATSGILFLWGARLNRARFFPAAMFAGMAFLGMVRELDYFFDRIVHGFWQAPAALIALVMAIIIWRHRKEMFTLFAREVVLPYWGMMCAGFGFVGIFSRLFGMRGNWQQMLAESWKTMADSAFTLSGNTDQAAFMEQWNGAVSQNWNGLTRSIRRLAEEGTELAGYTLILLAALGFVISCFHSREKKTSA